jgi:hypothetical protein
MDDDAMAGRMEKERDVLKGVSICHPSSFAFNFQVVQHLNGTASVSLSNEIQ